MPARPPAGGRVLLALSFCVGTVVLPPALTAASPGSNHRWGPFDAPVCRAGALTTAAPGTGVRMVLGTCGEPAASPPGSATPLASAMLPDCQMSGYDDRCEAWAAPRYDGPWGGDDWPGFGSVDRVETVLPTPDGKLVIVGGTSTYGSGTAYDADFVQVAYSAETGRPVWTSTWEGDGERYLAYESQIALSEDGGTLYALGLVAGSDYLYSSYVVAFDASTGRQLWHWKAPIYANAIAAADVTLPDGRVEPRLYLAGTGVPEGEQKLAGAVAALDPAGPNLVWRGFNRDPEGTGSLFNALAVSSDGSSVFATGGDFRPDTLRRNFATAAYRAIDGEPLWASRDQLTAPNGFFGNNGANDIAVSADGSRVFIAGFDPVSGSDLVDPNDSYSALVTVGRDAATGDILWRGNYVGPVAGERHFYFSLFMPLLAVTPDGASVVATGGYGSHGSATVAYDASTGARRWGIESTDTTYRFSGWIGFYPTLAMSADGARVFVTNPRGFGFSSTSFVTQAYSMSTGATAWTARFIHNVSYPAGIVAAPAGDRVYVTGITKTLDTFLNTSQHTRDSFDIQTVAYAA